MNDLLELLEKNKKLVRENKVVIIALFVTWLIFAGYFITHSGGCT